MVLPVRRKDLSVHKTRCSKTQTLDRFMTGILVSLCVFRPGVRLQSVRFVSQGEQHGAELRQDVHRPRGEQRWVRLCVAITGVSV